MKPKKTILILCDWFLPGYLAGGPIQSIATLTAHLKEEFDFKIITTDRDFKSSVPYAGIKINEWTEFQGRQIFYVSPENMNLTFVLQLIQSTAHDVIYLNSLFSKLFTVYPLKWKQQGKLTSKIVLAPRGMLRDAALAVKPLKKKLFIFYAKSFGLFKNIQWQSTSKQETQEIKNRIGANVSVTEVSNLPDFVNDTKAIEKQSGELKLCFIARIVDIKNLNFAIDVLKQMTQGKITYDIYGPKEDEAYWQQCELNAKELPANVSFSYKGSLEPSTIRKTLSNYHALFLPTQTENFGHVIVQSLQYGRPVIISNNTPWLQLENENAGYDIDLKDKTKFVNAVKSLIQLNQYSFEEISKSSMAYINNRLNIDDIKAKYVKLLNDE